ncbi:MAG TPA: SCO1664 family protein [Actinomycetota bacterium]|nr:SCO1664 family protein [Actinomycetota bacterium]
MDDEQTLELLRTGDVEVLGLLPYSSNYTFLTRVAEDTLAVYKPRRGERPLWDFPHGSLAGREVAAYLVSEAAGWGIVPPTVLREDAPLGPGSLQLFVEHDPERHYFVIMEERSEDLVPFAAFDVVVNNADRKSGHVIEDPSGRLWAVDHGVTFHPDDKLRTVIWAYAGLPLDRKTISELETLGAALAEPGGLSDRLEELLTPAEVAATLGRTETLLVEGRFPGPPADRPLPWPLV